MCLTAVTGKPEKEEGEGYKVFTPDDSYHLYFCYYAPEGEGKRIKYDHWYKEEGEDKRIAVPYSTGDRSYPVGFHVYLDYPASYTPRCIRRVSYRGAHTEGTQGNHRVIVAKEILIHRKGK